MSEEKEDRSEEAESGKPAGKVKPGKKKVPRQQLEKRLAAAEEELEAGRDKLLRLQAEFENYKKRQAREREVYRRGANEDLLKAMLPVLDNLERAVEHGEESADVVQLLEGVQLVVRQMRENFIQYGVKAVDAQGEPFNPHEHEAMSTVDTDGDPPEGTVVEVYQKGYLLNGRVLRPAMVAVAKKVDGGGEEG